MRVVAAANGDVKEEEEEEMLVEGGERVAMQPQVMDKDSRRLPHFLGLGETAGGRAPQVFGRSCERRWESGRARPGRWQVLLIQPDHPIAHDARCFDTGICPAIIIVLARTRSLPDSSRDIQYQCYCYG